MRNRLGANIPDAPADEKTYARKSSAWSEVNDVKVQPATADLTADPTMADFNSLLAKLRSAGILAA